MAADGLGERQNTVTVAPRPRTILGPLPTTFEPPATCKVPFMECSTCSYLRYAQKCVNGGHADAVECYPSTSTGVMPPTQPLNGWGFYSPGTACPSGYSVACTASVVADQAFGWPFEFSLTKGETALGCCPRGMGCFTHLNPAGVQSCVAYQNSTVTDLASCGPGGKAEELSWNLPSTWTVTTEQTVSDGSVSTTIKEGVLATATLFAPLIQINFRAQDLTLAASSSSAPTSTSSGAPASAMNMNEGSSGGLAAGAAAGISVAALVGLAAIAGAALVCWRRRRRSGTGYKAAAPGPDNMAYEMGEGQKRMELPGSSVFAIPGPPVELTTDPPAPRH